jgi:hypothetical protein
MRQRTAVACREFLDRLFFFEKISGKKSPKKIDRHPKKILKKTGPPSASRIFFCFYIPLTRFLSDNPRDTTPPGRSGGHAKGGSQTLISAYNARFAKRGIFRKPRKTPGFHPGHMQCPFSQRGYFRHFHDLGRFSVMRKELDQRSGGQEKGP